MSNQYRSVLAGTAGTGGDAVAADVLSGKTFTNDNGSQTGSMTNNGAVSQSLSAGQSYTIPAGYHNGSGTVTALSSSVTMQYAGGNPQSYNITASKMLVTLARTTSGGDTDCKVNGTSLTPVTTQSPSSLNVALYEAENLNNATVSVTGYGSIVTVS